MARYDGKRVVLLGGTSGIGLATVKMLIAEGARVLVTGSAEASVDAARAELGSAATVVRSDIGSITDNVALAEEARTRWGQVDALIIAAGYNAFEPFEATSEESYDKIFRINARGPYFAIQKFVPIIVEGGSIVVITSAANVIGIPMISAYAAAKAALRSMVRSLARELLPRRIRVNALSPGAVDSGVLEKMMPKEVAEQTKQQMAEGNPLKRSGTTEEIAKGLLFLAFEATFNTGAEFPMDGGGTQI